MTGPIRRRPNPSRSELGTETPSEKMGGRLHPQPRARRVFGAVDLAGGRTHEGVHSWKNKLPDRVAAPAQMGSALRLVMERVRN